MKKKILGISLIVSFALATAWHVNNNNRSNDDLSDLVLDNIEALASNESSCCVEGNFQITAIPGGWRCENDKGNSCCPVC